MKAGGKRRSGLGSLLAVAAVCAAGLARAQQVPSATVPQAPLGAPVVAPNQSEPDGQTPTGEKRSGLFLQPLIGQQFTVTDNAAFEGGSLARYDVISDTRAGFDLMYQGPKLRAEGSMHADLYHYMRGIGIDRTEPSGALDAVWEPVSRSLFVDTGVTASRVINNPLAATPSAGSTYNTSSVEQLHLSPRFEGEIGPGYHYRLSSENAWTPGSGATTPPGTAPAAAELTERPNSDVERTALDFERLALPFGMAVGAETSRTHYGAPYAESLFTDTVRAIPRYRFADQLLVGLRGGYQHNTFALQPDDRNRAIVGADLSWHPSARTEVAGFAETGALGPAWQGYLRSRVGSFVVEMHGTHSIATASATQLHSTGIGTLPELLDSYYRSSIPDQVERARMVSQLVATLDLANASPLTAADPFVPTLIRSTDASASVLYLTPRNLAVLSLFGRNSDPVQIAGVAPSPALIALGAYRDIGTSLNFVHRLTTRQALTLGGSFDDTHGLEINNGLNSRERRFVLQWTQTLSRRVQAAIGATRHSITSNAVPSAAEDTVYVSASYLP